MTKYKLFQGFMHPVDDNEESSCDPCVAKPIESSRITYDGPNLPCTGVQTCDTLTTTVQKFDYYICALKTAVFGTSGANVTAGTSGTSGVNGIGTSGTNGTSGTSGTSGGQGSSGNDGSSGTSGTSGTSGINAVYSVEDREWGFADVIAGSEQWWDIDVSATFNYQITQLVLVTLEGTLNNVYVTKNDVVLANLSGLTITSTRSYTIPTAHSIAIGDRIKLHTTSSFSGAVTYIGGKTEIIRI